MASPDQERRMVPYFDCSLLKGADCGPAQAGFDRKTKLETCMELGVKWWTLSPFWAGGLGIISV